jgi:hypothetical protein
MSQNAPPTFARAADRINISQKFTDMAVLLPPALRLAMGSPMPVSEAALERGERVFFLYSTSRVHQSAT